MLVVLWIVDFVEKISGKVKSILIFIFDIFLLQLDFIHFILSYG